MSSFKRMGASTLLISSLFLQSPFAISGITPQITTDFNSALHGSVIPNPGDKINWANGVLTRLPDGKIEYVNDHNGHYNKVISSAEDIKTLATDNGDVRSEWIKDYGVDVLATPEQMAQNNKTLSNVFGRGGTPNSAFPFSPAGYPNYSLNYDDDGLPSSVTGPDGVKISIDDFKASNVYSAMIGANEGSPAVATSGPVSQVDNRTDEEKENDYRNKTFNLASVLWGMSEVGTKSCKPAGPAYTPTLVHWWEAIVGNKNKNVMGYIEAEKARDALLLARLDLVKKASEELIAAKGNAESMQVGAIQLQIESLNASIDSIKGTTLFNLDKEQEKAADTARIPTREHLYLAATEAIVANNEDNLKNVDIFNKLVDGITKSSEIANRACLRKKKVEECSETPEGVKTCVTKEVADPVPGSCEMVSKYLPVYHRGPVTDYANIYVLPQVPSIQLNERMGRLEELMKEMISMFPNHKDFNWTAPLIPTLKAMVEARKSVGALCPSTATDKDYNRAAFAKIAPSGNDPMMEMGRYALGVNLDKVEYKFANNYFEQTKKEKNLSDYDAKKATWDMMIFSERGSYYLKNNKGQDPKDYPKAESDFHASLAKEYALEPTPCTSNTCNTFSGEKRVDPTVGALGAEKLSDNAKDFLVTFGITGSSADLAVDTFVHNWNLTDLVIGQPGQRNTYFKYNQTLLEELVKADAEKYKALYTQRAKLLLYLDKIKLAFNGGDSKTGGSTAGKNSVSASGRTLSLSTLGVAGNNSYSVGSDGSSTAKVSAKAANSQNGSVQTDTMKAVSSNGVQVAITGTPTGSQGSYSVRAAAARAELNSAFSNNTQAIARKLEAKAAQAKRKLGQLASSGGSRKANMAAGEASEKSPASFLNQMEKSNKNFLSNPLSSAISNSISGVSRSNNSPASGVGKSGSTTRTTRDLGYSYSSGDSQVSYNESSGGRSGGSYSSSSSASRSVGSSEKGDSMAPATRPTYESGRHQRVEPIELFDTISGAYKRNLKRIGAE